jgi:hypothetical protein
VDSSAVAVALVRAREGVYVLGDSEAVQDMVFQDYMARKAPDEQLCGITYTEEFRSEARPLQLTASPRFSQVPVGFIFPPGSAALRRLALPALTSITRDKFNLVLQRLAQSGLLARALRDRRPPSLPPSTPSGGPAQL